MPDAGGLVIATDQTAARAYAASAAGDHRRPRPRWCCPTTAAPSARIARFAESDERWMVAVRMVSRGRGRAAPGRRRVRDHASTPLYFAQAIGRFVRARRPGETASVFLPSVPPLLRLAGELEAVRDHVLGRRRSDADEEAAGTTTCSPRRRRRRDEQTDDDKAFTALGASAHLDQVIFDGASFGTGATPGTPEEEDYLGLPGLLDPDQVATLLRAPAGQAGRAAEEGAARGDRAGAARAAADGDPRAPGRAAQAAQRAGGRAPPPDRAAARGIHTSCAGQCGGPPTAVCTVEQLEQRIATIQSW